MDIATIAENIIQKSDKKLKEIYFVACGGSLVDMYVSNYLIMHESMSLVSGWVTGNEFAKATPKRLGKQSLVILCSHSGNTPETVDAGIIAKKAGAQTVGFTFNENADLLKITDYSYVYDWGNEREVDNNPMALIMNLTVEVLRKIEGFENYSKFKDGLKKINSIVANAEDFVQQRAKNFAVARADEKLFNVIGSGATFGQIYGFAICSLMEMQWINAIAINSGEFFHGPFEVTDKELPFILTLSVGKTRYLDERVKSFLNSYAKKIEIIDAKELGLDLIDEEVAEYFNPILFYSVLAQYRKALGNVRNHPLDIRRYMGKVEY
ncbi:SIS domain-containing protein [Liquorilactobacillus mali]|nr:SIS domain-containing protein [Liquorilactobacillus mali]MDN7146263.1 SIS domain-containing protein [Liquorilactobacillus mali]